MKTVKPVTKAQKKLVKQQRSVRQNARGRQWIGKE